MYVLVERQSVGCIDGVIDDRTIAEADRHTQDESSEEVSGVLVAIVLHAGLRQRASSVRLRAPHSFCAVAAEIGSLVELASESAASPSRRMLLLGEGPPSLTSTSEEEEEDGDDMLKGGRESTYDQIPELPAPRLTHLLLERAQPTVPLSLTSQV